MKKLLLTLSVFAGMMTANAQGVYQIPNSDFENWAGDKEPGNGWNSFASAEGKFSSLAFLSPNPSPVEGYTGAYAVKLTSLDAGLAKANGNLTTGTVNMGNTDPKSSSNYNFTNLDKEGHYLEFAGIPDAVSCMAKFKSGGSPSGRGKFIIHNECEYRDPELDSDADKKIASATIYIEETDVWQPFSAKFDYTGVERTGKQYMLASFTTNETPGGSANDELIIDDVKLIYYSELASLNYDGKDYFQKEITAYSIDAVYDDSKLTCTSNGKGATIEKSYDKNTGKLTITVKGNDFSVNQENKHTYTIQFKTIKQYTNSLMVVVDGKPTEPTEKTIDLITEADGSTSFAIYDFKFGSLSVGDVVVTNLNVSQEGNKTIYTGKQDITVMETLPATVDVTATVENDKMTATIPIEVMGGAMHVDVTFAPALVIDGQSAVSIENAGLHNVTISRTFPAGWSTICLPFATTTAAFGEGAKAQAFTSADANGLNFTGVTDLEANKPYLIYFPKKEEAETTPAAPIYMSAEVSSTTPVAVTYGDFTFCGSYAASISMAGKYGVADQGDVQKLMLGGEHSTLGATRAYFTKKGAQPAEINLNLWGDATGIDAVTNDAETFNVYNLQGVMVRQNVNTLNGLQKGIYIVNGKKVSVK